MTAHPDEGRTALLVAPYYPPEGGGLERYVEAISTRLAAEHGWRVVVATSGPSRWRSSTAESAGVVVHRLPHQIRLSSTRFGLTWRRDLARIVASVRPTIINAHLPVPGLADVVRLVRPVCPVVVTYHSGTMRKGRPLPDLLVDGYERSGGRALLDRADWIVASSDYVRDGYLARVRAKTTTVTPGVDLDLFRPAAGRSPGRLLFVGRLDRGQEHKGLAELLGVVARLAERHDDVVLDVVGDGNRRSDYEQQARALGVGDRVRFLGARSGGELAEAYRAAGILVLPTRNDSFPLVVFEAMASGLAVVSTRAGSIPDQVADGETGLLSPPGDDEALTERIARLLDDPDLGDRFGAAGRRRAVERFSWSGRAAATSDLFEAVIDGRAVDGRTRVAIVTPRYYPEIGGVERYTHELATRFQRSGRYEVTVMTSARHGDGPAAQVADGVTVLRLAPWLTVSNTPIGPLWPIRLRSLVRANRVEIMSVHSPVPFMAEAAALAAGSTPIVLTYHAGPMAKGRLGVDLVIAGYECWLLPRLLRSATVVVAVSAFVRDRLAGLVGDAVEVISPGVDVDAFAPGAGSPGPARILYVGRMERSSSWKGVEVLIDAFAHVAACRHDVELVLAGSGDAVGSHLAHADRLGLSDRVRHVGAVRGGDLVQQYRDASVVVLPSTSGAESFGVTLIEAMACGRPVVGSLVGGIPQVIDDGDDGLLVPPADAAALAKACLALLDDPERAAAMGRCGRAKVERRYSWDAEVAAHGRLIDRLVGDGGRIRPAAAGESVW